MFVFLKYGSYTGDILALSINHLDSLLQMPLGCGEQNMIHFAPNVYVLLYLDKSSQENPELWSKAVGYLEEGNLTVAVDGNIRCEVISGTNRVFWGISKDIRDSCHTNERMDHSVPSETATPPVVLGKSGSTLYFQVDF